MRTLALSQAWMERGGAVTYYIATIPEPLVGRLLREGIRTIMVDEEPGSPGDAQSVKDGAAEFLPAAVVLDGYHFDAEFQRMVLDLDCKTVVVDDTGHLKKYYADIILNQNLGAGVELYPDIPNGCRLLLGSPYALLRREFLGRQQGLKNAPDIATRILVTLGGSDPDNVTMKVLEAIDRLGRKNLEVVVVAGGANVHFGALASRAERMGCKPKVRQAVDNMPELMEWAHLAVSAAGSSCWEMAYMGLPNIVISLAENQRGIARSVGEYGCSMNLGWYETVSVESLAAALDDLSAQPGTRAAMSVKGRELIDGKGAARVMEAINA